MVVTQQVLEINQETLQQLSFYLQATLAVEKQSRKDAEKYLEAVEGSQNYGILLLTIVSHENADIMLRLAAAITFKNFVKRNWRKIEGEVNKVSDPDRTTIKSLIIDLMLKSPEKLQKQLSDAISIIGREDFPGEWQELLPSMVEHIKSDNLHVVNGILQTAHSLFKRFRYEFKSQELWTELKYILDNFAAPFTDLFVRLCALVKSNMGDDKKLRDIFEPLITTCKLFYSLNYQDLPEYFEENMEKWMGHFHTLLVTEYKKLESDDDSDEAGPLERIRSQICDNVAMYAQKYDEEFQPYLAKFVSAIWNLLVTTGNKVKHDLLVSNAIQFLASVCEKVQYKDLFKDEETLRSICEKVIVPNMEFRDADEEVFEDNPEEYIRRDMEGSDIDTRRRAACDLVRGLCKHFEEAVTGIFSHYVGALLQMYATNPENNWKSKDAAIFLVTSLAAKKSTTKHGTTEISSLVNIVDFFKNQIAPDLDSPDVDKHPVLKADAIKYIITFRSVLPREVLSSSLHCIVRLLQAQSNVVHSYAAICLEKLFTLKTPGGGKPFGVADLEPIKETVLQNLFGIFGKANSSENDYAMKAIMRTISMMQEHVVPYAGLIMGGLSEKIAIASKNPSKPHFNHYLFEATCALIRATGKVKPSELQMFEGKLFPVMEEILKQDVTEFIPYIFQVLSLLLEVREGGIQGPYMALFPLLLQSVLWERTGNVPALTRLLQAYVKRGSAEIVAQQKLMPMLGVFQKLISSKAHDHEGFYLLGSIIEHMEWAVIESHIREIFILIFQRLQNSKTAKFVKGFLVFVCLFAGKKGGPHVVQAIDSVQPKLFGMVIEKLFIAEMKKVSGKVERKICAVGFTKIVTETPALLEPDYISLWPKSLQLLIELFELPEDDSTPDDEHFIDVEETPGYQTAFSQLMFAGKKDQDPFPDIDKPRIFLAQKLHQLSSSCPGKLTPIMSSGMDPQATSFLQSYLQGAQVTIL